MNISFRPRRPASLPGAGPAGPRIRPAVALLVSATLTVAGAVTVTTGFATGAGAAVPFAAGVEDEGADCPVTLPGSTAANSRLPDPFLRLNGTRIVAKSDWRCRREEIKKLAERSVYGEKPGKPQSVTGTVSSSTITVNVTHNGRSASFSAGVSLPSGTGPFPAVVVLGGMGADTSTIRSVGAAVINYDPLAVGKEGTARNNKQGAFYSIYGATSSTGILMAWSWGVSRIIDVIEQSGGNILRADGTGVTGCSRYGKGAFVIGVFDQRIALTMPIESGSGGVGAFRSIATESGAQPLSSAYSEQPWLGDAFSSFTGSPNNLPVDTHEMVGMVAPRGLFIMDNPHIDWLGARSGSVAALGGAEVYKALGAGGNITYWSDVSDGTHCAVRSEWRTPLQQNIQRFMLNSGSYSGTMRISSRKSGNLAEWRDWQTPTLTDGPTTTTTTTTMTTRTSTTTWPTTTTSTTMTWPTTTTTTRTTPTTTTTTTTSQQQGGCTAAYSVSSQWGGGFVANVNVTAGSTAINGWRVTMTLPGGASITNLWNGVNTGTSGTVTVTNAAYNGRLGAGQTTNFGFVGNGTGTGTTVTCTAT